MKSVKNSPLLPVSNVNEQYTAEHEPAQQRVWLGRTISLPAGEEENLPASRQGDTDSGPFLFGGGAFMLGFITIIASKSHCGAHLFQNWESNACLFFNAGGIMVISSTATLAVALALICCIGSCALCVALKK